MRFAETGDLLNGGIGAFRAMQAQLARPGAAHTRPADRDRAFGTTYMMSRLAQHPGIVVAPEYPFEIKLLAYYSAWLRTLVSSADRKDLHRTRGDDPTVAPFLHRAQPVQCTQPVQPLQ